MDTPLDRKRLDDLQADDLRLLIEDQIPEGKSIDYKQTLPGKEDRERKEFLHDVSSFANASGGYLVYGVKEEKGVPIDLCGVRDINPDQEKARLEEMIRSGIRPRIFGIQLRAVPIQESLWVILIKIPKSWNPPHQVTFQTDMRFSARGQMGKYLMDVDELRSTLEVSDSIGEKARNFRLARIAKVIAGETPSEATEGAFVVLHFLPMAAFTGRINLSFPKNNGHWPFEPPPFNSGGAGFTPKYCFDGYVFASGYPKNETYRLFFRSGAMEYTDFHQTRSDPNDRYAMKLHAGYLEQDVRKGLEHALYVAKTLEIDMPAFVSLSLIGFKGWRLFRGDRFFDSFPPFDRDTLLTSENLIDGFEGDLDTIHKALVDPIWHAAGCEQSPNFPDGKWKSER